MKKFALFLGVGGVAAICNILSRILLNTVLTYEWSVLAAYVVGMIIAFVLSRMWVFDVSQRAVSVQLSRFALVNVVSLVQVWTVSVLLARYLLPAMSFKGHAELLAHSIGVASTAATSFALHRGFSFR